MIGGLLSDKSFLGNAASINLPFYCALGLVVITMVLVKIFYHDVREHNEKLRIQPLEISRLLWKIREHPVVMRISLVFFCFMVAKVTFYIFMDNYLTSRFQMGLFGTSMAMMVLGIALATASSLFVEPAQKRFEKRTIIIAATCVMAVCSLLFVLAPRPLYCYFLIAAFYFGFGLSYPTVLRIFSASVDDNEQGWVMGITTAQFTLAAGIMSLVGGELMSFDIRSPFYVSVGAALIAFLLLFVAWNQPEVRRISR